MTVAGSPDVPGPLDADVQSLCRRAWWVFLVSGIASVAFGVLAFVNPLVALFVLAAFFAAYLLVDGIANVVGSFQNRGRDGWWILLLIGLLGDRRRRIQDRLRLQGAEPPKPACGADSRLTAAPQGSAAGGADPPVQAERPAIRPPNRHPPRKVPSRPRLPFMPPPPNPAASPAA